MTTPRRVLAALALTAALCGCAPVPGGATKPTAPDRPAADPRAAALSPVDVRALATEAAPPLRPALLNAAEIREHEARLTTVWAGVRPKHDRPQLGPGWDGPAATLADLRAAAKILRDTAGEALRTHAEFAAVVAQYRNALARGPAALRQAADYYRGKAEDAPNGCSATSTPSWPTTA